MKHRRPLEIGLHALDLNFVRDELVPWVLGEASGDLPRLEPMARVLHTRHAANQFGQSLAAAYTELATERARDRHVPSLGERLLEIAGISPRLSIDDEDLSDAFGAFHPRLHVSGRPFLVSASSMAELLSGVTDYLGTSSDAQLLPLLRRHLQSIAPRQLEHLSLDLPDFDPPFAAAYVREPLERMRDILLRRPPRDDDEAPKRDARFDSMLPSLIRAAAHVGASWLLVDTSPSLSLERADVTFLAMEDAFCFAEDLFTPLPWLKWDIEQTLVGKGLGAVIEAKQVPGFRACVLRNRARLLKVSSELELQKMDECLAFAEAMHLDVIESRGLLSSDEGLLP